jgi:hypothetical protein
VPSSFVSESRLGGLLHAPPCGLEPSHLGFPPGITWERRLKPPGPNLIGGGISPCLILWRGACPGWLSPPNGHPSSTQILTRYYSAQSQTVSQLTNSGTVPTSESPLFSPSGSSKHLRMGSACMPCHILTNQAGPWGFINSSAQTK